MKPRLITTTCVANRYAAPNERIAEFSFPEADDCPGGLISFRYLNDGSCAVELYRLSGNVKVAVPKRHECDNGR